MKGLIYMAMYFLAADLGASNGRVMMGSFDGEKVSLSEVSRFSNEYVHVGDADYWDILGIYSNVVKGIAAGAKNSRELSGIGIDTWGVDFGLIDRQGRLIGNPRSYRDPRGLRGMEAFRGKYGDKAAFEITGIADNEFNTLYQLYDMAVTGDPQLEAADKLLLLPDLLGYMLCGEISSEYTISTTTQMMDAASGGWSEKILEMAGIKGSLMCPITPSGTVKGSLRRYVLQETGLEKAPPVFCVGSHDTASAVASVPAKDGDFAFISSGTWSVVGIVSEKAVINETAYKDGFSNEGAVDGKYRLLRNIMGMWIIQNCKRQWDRVKASGWDDIVESAKAAPPFRSFIDVSAGVFYDADSMPQKIQRYCSATGQHVPQTQGEIARTVYESLAMSYREAFDGLEKIKGSKIATLHIVGGGSKNSLLNQFAANAINREVTSGPAEAAAAGNIMMQVKASGGVKDMAQMRDVIRGSFAVESYEPKEADIWDEQYQRYLAIKKSYKGL